jgi:hypothetical protein
MALGLRLGPNGLKNQLDRGGMGRCRGREDRSGPRRKLMKKPASRLGFQGASQSSKQGRSLRGVRKYRGDYPPVQGDTSRGWLRPALSWTSSHRILRANYKFTIARGASFRGRLSSHARGPTSQAASPGLGVLIRGAGGLAPPYRRGPEPPAGLKGAKAHHRRSGHSRRSDFSVSRATGILGRTEKVRESERMRAQGLYPLYRVGARTAGVIIQTASLAARESRKSATLRASYARPWRGREGEGQTERGCIIHQLVYGLCGFARTLPQVSPRRPRRPRPRRAIPKCMA